MKHETSREIVPLTLSNIPVRRMEPIFGNLIFNRICLLEGTYSSISTVVRVTIDQASTVLAALN